MFLPLERQFPVHTPYVHRRKANIRYIPRMCSDVSAQRFPLHPDGQNGGAGVGTDGAGQFFSYSPAPLYCVYARFLAQVRALFSDLRHRPTDLRHLCTDLHHRESHLRHLCTDLHRRPAYLCHRGIPA